MFNFPGWEENTFDNACLINSKRQGVSEDYSALSGKTIMRETTMTFCCATYPTPYGYKIRKSSSSTTSHDSVHTIPDLLTPEVSESSSSPKHVFVQYIVSDQETLSDYDSYNAYKHCMTLVEKPITINISTE